MSNCDNVEEICLEELCSERLQLSENIRNESDLEISKLGFGLLLLSVFIVGAVIAVLLTNKHYTKKKVEASRDYFKSVTLKRRKQGSQFTVDQVGRPLSDNRYEGAEFPANIELDETAGESRRKIRQLAGNFSSGELCLNENEYGLDEEDDDEEDEEAAKSNFLQRFKNRFGSNRNQNNKGRRKSTNAPKLLETIKERVLSAGHPRKMSENEEVDVPESKV